MSTGELVDIVADYIDSIPLERRERAATLHRVVCRLFPAAEISMLYKMPTYHCGEHFFAWGNKKNYLSLYTCSSSRIAIFKRKYPNISTGVGCINIKNRDGFPLEVIEQVVRNALAPSAAILALEAKAIQKSASKNKKSSSSKK